VVVNSACQWENPSASTDVWLGKAGPDAVTHLTIFCRSPWRP
jgi:hypothetical protein